MLHKGQNYKKKQNVTRKQAKLLCRIQFSDKAKLHVDPKQRSSIEQCTLREKERTDRHTVWMWRLWALILCITSIYYASRTLPLLPNSVSLDCQWTLKKKRRVNPSAHVSPSLAQTALWHLKLHLSLKYMEDKMNRGVWKPGIKPILHSFICTGMHITSTQVRMRTSVRHTPIGFAWLRPSVTQVEKKKKSLVWLDTSFSQQ